MRTKQGVTVVGEKMSPQIALFVDGESLVVCVAKSVGMRSRRLILAYLSSKSACSLG